MYIIISYCHIPNYHKFSGLRKSILISQFYTWESWAWFRRLFCSEFHRSWNETVGQTELSTQRLRWMKLFSAHLDGWPEFSCRASHPCGTLRSMFSLLAVCSPGDVFRSKVCIQILRNTVLSRTWQFSLCKVQRSSIFLSLFFKSSCV